MLTYYSLTFTSSEQQVPQVSDFDNHTYDTIPEISSKVQVRTTPFTLFSDCTTLGYTHITPCIMGNHFSCSYVYTTHAYLFINLTIPKGLLYIGSTGHNLHFSMQCSPSVCLKSINTCASAG